jgi:hypothetical protein
VPGGVSCLWVQRETILGPKKEQKLNHPDLRDYFEKQINNFPLFYTRMHTSAELLAKVHDINKHNTKFSLFISELS